MQNSLGSIGRILCTEDHPDSREMLVMMLETAGYEVVCPADGALALQLAEHQHFDLCLLDNWADGLTGVQLTERIRAFDNRVPILFYSGVAGAKDQQAALAAGAQSYLVKPDGIADLVREISQLIRKSKTAAA